MGPGKSRRGAVADLPVDSTGLGFGCRAQRMHGIGLGSAKPGHRVVVAFKQVGKDFHRCVEQFAQLGQVAVLRV